ncbi:MAG TPA: hypothetical protein VFA60_11710 [Terriglobales bacterium]|nr:hypothetical protein [Terriglobales bacterium]
MAAKTEIKKALIVVRTYPTPAKNGAEVSCTAAITDKGEWLRLFPVPWRYLAAEQQFRRYQHVELTVEKATDPRPESYKLKQNGIKILSEPLPTDHDWRPRKEIIEPLRAHCLCCLAKQRDAQGHPTLGIFRPKHIEKLIIAPDTPDWTAAQRAILEQGHLFAEKPKKQLEKIPFRFQYKFGCDDSSCSGHTMICTDWEMAESYRRWKQDYSEKWEEKFRQRYEKEMIEKYDTSFYVGTVHQHPGTWIIVGLFYPPKVAQAALF